LKIPLFLTATLLILTSLVLTSNGALAQLPPSSNDESAREIKQVSAKFSDAFMRGAADEMVSMYSPSAVIVPHRDLPIYGQSAIREYFDLPSGREITHHEMRSTQLLVDGDTARDIGQYEISGTNGDTHWGPVFGNYLIIWRRAEQGDWLMDLNMWNSRPEPTRPTNRQVAITFDDLPGVAIAGDNCSSTDWESFTSRMLEAIQKSKIPALGLVTASRVCDELRYELLPKLLTEWLDAGLELGNHSFSHQDLNSTPVEEYVADLARTTEIVRPLVEAHGQEFKYFRYPFLHSGDDTATKIAVQTILSDMGYVNAPVTIDNQEWIFATVYARAKARGDHELMQRIGDAYIPFMNDVFAFFEKYSIDVLGYEPPQVLLLHANDINADYLEDLVDMMRGRGYTFVSMDEAMTDEAYRRVDDYVGPVGYSWLHRWGISAAVSYQKEPTEPQWLSDLLNSN